jgi:hypothetical protein
VVTGLSNLAKIISVWLFLVHPAAYAFMAVWGTLMWSVMDEACFLQHNADFWSLILLFKIYVVLMYAGIVLSFCTAALQIAAASGALPTDIPGGLAAGFLSGAPAKSDGPSETTPLVSQGSEYV